MPSIASRGSAPTCHAASRASNCLRSKPVGQRQQTLARSVGVDRSGRQSVEPLPGDLVDVLARVVLLAQPAALRIDDQALDAGHLAGVGWHEDEVARGGEAFDLEALDGHLRLRRPEQTGSGSRCLRAVQRSELPPVQARRGEETRPKVEVGRDRRTVLVAHAQESFAAQLRQDAVEATAQYEAVGKAHGAGSVAASARGHDGRAARTARRGQQAQRAFDRERGQKTRDRDSARRSQQVSGRQALRGRRNRRLADRACRQVGRVAERHARGRDIRSHDRCVDAVEDDPDEQHAEAQEQAERGVALLASRRHE
jgi:hypothetical protein